MMIPAGGYIVVVQAYSDSARYSLSESSETALGFRPFYALALDTIFWNFLNPSSCSQGGSTKRCTNMPTLPYKVFLRRNQHGP